MKTIIKNVKIITLDEETIINGDVLIEDNLIKEVGEVKDQEVDKVINGNGNLLLPGLINGHTHIGMSLFKNYADDMKLDDWLNNKIWPLEEKLTEKEVYYGSLLSIVEMIKTGTTSFIDMYFFLEGVLKATIESGIRGNITRGFVNKDKKSQDNDIENTIMLFNKYNNYDNRIKIGIGPHSIYTCSKDYLLRLKELNNELNTFLNIHLSETLKEVSDSLKNNQVKPVEYLNSLGYLDEKLVIAHGVWIDFKEYKLLDKDNIVVVHNPSSNMKLSSGIAQVEDMLTNNINIAIGTDSSASNNNLNMFLELREASLLSKVNTFNPKSMKAYDTLKNSILNGAKALGYSNLGKIKPGYIADMIIIDINNYTYKPLNNIYSHLIYSEIGNNVITSIINGKVVMEEKELVNIDEKMIYYECEKLFNKLRGQNEK